MVAIKIDMIAAHISLPNAQFWSAGPENTIPRKGDIEVRLEES